MTLFYTYIAYNKLNSFKGVGVTNNLKRRFKLLNQLNKKKKCKLVYYEEYTERLLAIKREKVLNAFPENSLRELCLENNPMLVDLLKK